MIVATDLGIHFGDRVLFKNVSFQLNAGNRYGLVGANGSGKSTLLKILEGVVEPEAGSIAMPSDLSIGTLTQNRFAFDEEKIINTVIIGKKNLWDAMKEKDSLLLHDEITEKIGHRLAELEMIIAENDGYNAEAKAGEIISGLGVAEEFHHQPLGTLSGGYKLRVLLAQCLFSEPDCLILDEPTNHLDIIAIAWLEGFLKKFQGMLLVVSHDQCFLNQISTNIVDIDYETIKIYKGNYDAFVGAKELEAEQKGASIAKQEKKKEELQAFVDRFKAKASKARQASSRAKQIERMEDIEIIRSSRVSPRFSFPISKSSGKVVFRCNNISKSFKKKHVLKNVSALLERGERMAVIGPNGIGKSTLLKILMDILPASDGDVEYGHNVEIGYFAQDHHELIPDDSTPYEWLYSFGPGESIGTIRGLLGRVLFSKDDVHKSTKSLSGGEAARLLFARLMLQKPNLLILDEPTNHMDLESVNALSDTLSSYEGSIIFVSHYRHFVQTVATSVLELAHDGYNFYSGGYEEFCEYRGADFLGKAAAGSLSVKKEPTEKKNSEYRKVKKDISRLEKKILKAEERVSEIESKISTVEAELAGSDVYLPENSSILEQKVAEKKSLKVSLDETVEVWEKMQGEVEDLKKIIF